MWGGKEWSSSFAGSKQSWQGTLGNLSRLPENSAPRWSLMWGCLPSAAQTREEVLLNSSSARVASSLRWHTGLHVTERKDMECSQCLVLCIYYKVVIHTMQIMYYKLINTVGAHFVKSEHTYTHTVSHTHTHTHIHTYISLNHLSLWEETESL